MKYLGLVVLFLIGVYFWLNLNFFPNDWQYVQPLLIISLLVYFNSSNPWIYYSFAASAGLFLASLTALFGLHAIIFVSIIFILRILQLTLLTSKNILTILLLTFLSFIIFWGMYYILTPLFATSVEILSGNLLNLVKGIGTSIFLTMLLHIFFYNLWLKKYESR